MAVGLHSQFMKDAGWALRCLGEESWVADMAICTLQQDSGEPTDESDDAQHADDRSHEQALTPC